MRGIPQIPYFQTSRYRVQSMVELAEIKPEEVGADLGTGDGRISIAFAKTGIDMHAYEIDVDLQKLTEENLKKESFTFSDKSKSWTQHDKSGHIFLHHKDFWHEDLSPYNIICCYPMPTIMGRLERKLQKELKPGARVLLNYFPFKHWKEVKRKDNIFLYKR